MEMGRSRKKAKEFVKLNKLKVKFHGFDKKVDEYLQNYRYVFTSRIFGILEAMVMRKTYSAEYNNEIKKDYLIMVFLLPVYRFLRI